MSFKTFNDKLRKSLLFVWYIYIYITNNLFCHDTINTRILWRETLMNNIFVVQDYIINIAYKPEHRLIGKVSSNYSIRLIR